MRFNGRAYTDAQQLAALVAADGASGGFLKDSEASTFARTYLDDTTGRAFAATVGLWYPLAASAVTGMSVTGTLTETALATVTIPAGAMGANGILRVTLRWTCSSSTNSKILSVRLGGIAGTLLYARPTLTSLSLQVNDVVTVANRNSQSSQVFGALDQFTWNSGTNPVVTASVNTAVAQDLVLTGTLANTGDTVGIANYLVEVLYGA